MQEGNKTTLLDQHRQEKSNRGLGTRYCNGFADGAGKIRPELASGLRCGIHDPVNHHVIYEQ